MVLSHGEKPGIMTFSLDLGGDCYICEELSLPVNL